MERVVDKAPMEKETPAAVEKEVPAAVEKEVPVAMVEEAETEDKATLMAAEEAFSAEVDRFHSFGIFKSSTGASKVGAVVDGSCKDTSAMEWTTSITELGTSVVVASVAPPFFTPRSLSTPVLSKVVKVAEAAFNFFPTLDVFPLPPARPEFCNEALHGNALRSTAATSTVLASVKTLSSTLDRERVVL